MEENPLLSVQGQLLMSGITVWLIQRLKLARSMPWVNQNSEGICRALSVGAAVLTSAGFTFAARPAWARPRPYEPPLPFLAIAPISKHGGRRRTGLNPSQQRIMTPC